jgi:hypothetical protein
MRTILAASMLMLGSTVAMAQNTTGSLTPTAGTPRTVAQTPATQTPTTVTQPPATPSTTTNGTTTTDPATPGAFVPARDAAIVMCGQDFSTGGGAMLVFSASVSANGPAIAPGTACAQALADLFAAGFSVIDVQPFNQQLQYALVR